MTSKKEISRSIALSRQIFGSCDLYLDSDQYLHTKNELSTTRLSKVKSRGVESESYVVWVLARSQSLF